MSALVFKVGGEQRVNLVYQGEQRYAKSAPLADGGWLVTWTSYDEADDSSHIYMQRYDRNGQAVFYDADRRIDTSISSESERSSITALADGGWVVTWEGYNSSSSSYAIFQRHYDSADRPKGSEFTVGETTSDQSGANIVALSDGGWLMTWASWQDGSESGIYQQRFNSAGEAQFETSRKVNTHVDGRQDEPKTAVLKDGGWVTTWRSYDQDGSGYGIYQQRYNADGSAHGSETRVNIEVANNQLDPNIAALDDGGWIVVWESYAQDGSGSGIYQQRFDKNGTPLFDTDQFVNITIDGEQQDAVVTALKDGGWLVTWSSANASGLTDIYQQRYDRNGQPHYTVDQTVNTTLTDVQEFPFVTGLSSGGWVVT